MSTETQPAESALKAAIAVIREYPEAVAAAIAFARENDEDRANEFMWAGDRIEDYRNNKRSNICPADFRDSIGIQEAELALLDLERACDAMIAARKASAPVAQAAE